MSILHEERGVPPRPRAHISDLGAPGSPEDPGPVPSEERRRGVAVTLPEPLADYLRVLCSATKTPLRCALAELAASEEFKGAVEAYGQRLVADHVREVQAKLGARRPEGA